MSNKRNTIPPNREAVIILLSCAILSGILTLVGYKGNSPVTASPCLLLCISLISLFASLKTVEFSKNAIRIRYILFNRSIQWQKVRGIEFASQHDRHYLFICLRDCPLWCETNTSIKCYAAVHPFRLIPLRITEDQVTQYKEMIQIYCNSIHITKK